MKSIVIREKLIFIPLKTISMFLIYLFFHFLFRSKSFYWNHSMRLIDICLCARVRMLSSFDLFIPLEIVRSQNTVSFRFIFYKQLLQVSHSSLSFIQWNTHTLAHMYKSHFAHWFIHSPRVIRIYGILLHINPQID